MSDNRPVQYSLTLHYGASTFHFNGRPLRVYGEDGCARDALFSTARDAEECARVVSRLDTGTLTGWTINEVWSL